VSVSFNVLRYFFLYNYRVDPLNVTIFSRISLDLFALSVAQFGVFFVHCPLLFIGSLCALVIRNSQNNYEAAYSLLMS